MGLPISSGRVLAEVAEFRAQAAHPLSLVDMSEIIPSDDSDEASQPDATLAEQLMYGLTLPERTARSASAVVGGLLHESAARLIPAAFRSSRSYTTFVQQSLDMMIHDVGGIENTNAVADAEEVEAGLARKTVGGMLDFAGAATLHLSPMTVLAVFNDVAYGSGYFLGKLSDELKREGIIDESSTIHHVSDLVASLERASKRAADTMDAPPVSLSGITATIRELSAEVADVDPTKLIPQSEIEKMWGEMEDAASKADVGLWDVSTTMTMYAMNRVTLTTRGALSTVSIAGGLLNEHLVGHYASALTEINDQGLYQTLSTASRPYLSAVWKNFEAERETWTEELLTGRMLGKAWGSVRGWFGGDTAG